MAKIAFIYPAYESLGIEYLSSALKKSGHKTILILDPVLFNEAGFVNSSLLAKFFDCKYMIREQLKLIKPDLVAFSVTSDNFSWALNMAADIKSFSSLPIIFGGIHPTSVPEIVIKHDCVDFICIGEGEKALVELADNITKKDNYAIENIWFKHKGEVIQNNLRNLEANLDELPLPDKEIYYEKYPFIMKGGYAITTSRGCPCSCSYCCNSVLRQIYKNKGEYLRRRSVGNVLKELECAKKKYNPKYVHFVDEIFTYEKEWLSEFLSFYSKNIKLPFACYVSPQFVDEDRVSLLKKGGCYKAQMGIQSIDEKKRIDLLDRHYSNEQAALAINQFKQKKIYITCDNIFGLPQQDEKELIALSDFYCENKPNFIEVFWLRYYPRTKIIDIAQKLGYLDKNKIKKIEQSLDMAGIASGGDTYNRDFSRIHLLLNLFHAMPQKWRKILLKKKIYKFLPPLNPIFIAIISRLFNRARFDLYTTITFRRYIYFIVNRLFALNKTRQFDGKVISCPLCNNTICIFYFYGDIKIYKCSVCGMKFRERYSGNLLSSNSAECYRMLTESYPKIQMEENRLNRIIGYLNGTSRKIKILEIGSGCGVFGKLVLERGFEYWGVEPSSFLYEEAKNKIIPLKGNIFNVCFNNIDLRGELFDVIVMNDVLEHIEYPKEHIKFCFNALKQGGFIYIESPDDSFPLLKYLLAKIVLKNKVPILPAGHINIFSKKVLLKLMKDCGFNNVEVKYRGLWSDKNRVKLVLNKEKLPFYIELISNISKIIELDVFLRQRLFVCVAYCPVSIQN